jgi:hypothetical protein
MFIPFFCLDVRAHPELGFWFADPHSHSIPLPHNAMRRLAHPGCAAMKFPLVI